MSKAESDAKVTATIEDDEPDEWYAALLVERGSGLTGTGTRGYSARDAQVYMPQPDSLDTMTDLNS